MSDRIAVMNAGALEQLAAPADLYERPRTRFVAEFLGACNLLAATVRRVAGTLLEADTPLGLLHAQLTDDASEVLPGTRRTLAIRPEKVHLLVERPDESVNVVPATVTELIYRGSETTCRLLATGQPLSVTTLNARRSHATLRVGDGVFCHLPPEALLLLED